MKEILYIVHMKDKKTGENLELKVWGKNCEDATSKINNLFCYGAWYMWTGTEPMRDDKGEVIKRDK